VDNKKLIEWAAKQSEEIQKSLKDGGLLRAETGREITKEKLLEWMAGQPEETQVEIIEGQMKKMMENKVIKDWKVADVAGKKMLKYLVDSIRECWWISEKINPETGKKFDLLKDGKYYEKFKNLYANKLKVAGKKGAEKQLKIEKLGAEIIDFLTLGVSYSGLCQMLKSDYDIVVSKPYLAEIIKSNKWDEMAKEKRIKIEEEEGKVAEEKSETIECAKQSISSEID